MLHSALLTGLAQLFGLYRAALQQDDELLACLNSTGLEGQLLDQLMARLPAMGLKSSSNMDSAQSSSSNSNSSSSAGAGTAAKQDTANSSPPCATGGFAIAGCAGVEAAAWPQPGAANALLEADTSMHTDGFAAMQDSSCLESLQDPLPGKTQRQASTQLWQLQQLLQPVSPDQDPFLLARRVFLGPFDACAHTITLKGLKQLWLEDEQELRACLQQLQSTLQQGDVLLAAPPPADAGKEPVAAVTRARPPACTANVPLQDEQQHSNPLKAIRDRMMSMYYLINSLATVGRDNLYFVLQLENWKTGAGTHSHIHTYTASVSPAWPLPCAMPGHNQVLCSLSGRGAAWSTALVPVIQCFCCLPVLVTWVSWVFKTCVCICDVLCRRAPAGAVP